VLDAVGKTKATILSAYRTAETNAMLARTTFDVAEHSQHILGRALDIRLDARLSDALTTPRAMQRGGVGWYPHSGFIHIDAGPIRNWTLDEHGLEAANSPSAVPERMSGRWWKVPVTNVCDGQRRCGGTGRGLDVRHTQGP
jgi:Bacterial protein of unknown function (DUF882)